MHLHIDIETFSTVDLKKSGVYPYAANESFEILCICWYFDGKFGRWALWETRTAPPEFVAAINACTSGVAFNAQFERVCFQSAEGRSLALPDRIYTNEFWKCAAVRALANGLPGRLELAVNALDPTLTKHDGKSAMMKLSRPRKPTKNNSATRWTPEAAPDEYAALIDYCEYDVALELHVWEETYPLSDNEERMYQLDQRINQRGVRYDQPFAELAQQVGADYKKTLDARAQLLCPDITKLTQTKKIAELIGVDSIDKAYMQSDERAKLTGWKDKLLSMRQEYAKTSLAKYAAMLRADSGDGRLRGMFQMNGAAATNRWAGRIVQLQNLIRAVERDPDAAMSDVRDYPASQLMILYGSVLDLMSRLIRPTFIPTQGRLFAVADYAAIEARIVGWLADCDLYMTAFNGDGKIYEAMAAEVFGVGVDEIQNPSAERQLGKAIILGCGFQMGADKFVSTAQAQGSTESDELLRKAHAAYRKGTPEIAAYPDDATGDSGGLWSTMGAAATKAVRHPGQSYRVQMSPRAPAIEFAVFDDWLFMKLPSGRALAYYQPKMVFDEDHKRWGVTYMGIDSYTGKWTRLRTYGGKFTENAAQAIARDLLAHAMLKCDDAGIDTVIHVHDEIVAEADAIEASVTLQKLCAIMEDKPTWAAGLPVAAEGSVMKRYGK